MRERDNDAWIYLTKKRGLRPYWIKQFELGVVREPIRGHERYVGRVAIPYRTGLGEARGFRFRRLDDRRPKYDGDPGVQTHIFAPKYTAEKLVYITEGEINCIILHQIGLRAVGIPGANHFKREWRWAFRHADRVVGILDGDGDPKAALVFKNNITQNLEGIVPYTFVQMPRGYDVNSLYLWDRRKLSRMLEV